MLMMFSAPVHHFPSVVALLSAALAVGVALFHPTTIRGDWLPRAEWVLVVTLVVAGLLLTAGALARAFADPGSPIWIMVVAGYTILGMAAALLIFRKLPKIRWVFALFLVAHVAIAVMLLRSWPALSDVELFLRDGSIAILHGHNPFAMTIPNIYPPNLTKEFYGPGVVVNGRVTSGFPYPPLALLVAIPGYLLGDVRYGQLIAMVVTALVLRHLASDRVGDAASVLPVASALAIPILTFGWIEPISVALLACAVLALEQRRHAYAALSLGLLLVSKQYFVVVLPTIWLLRQFLTRRAILIGLTVAAGLTLPAFFIDPAAFLHAIVKFQLIQPFRPGSVSLLVSSVNILGWPPPWTYGVLPILCGGCTAIALALRAPRTPAAFAAASGLTLLVTILMSKEGSANYYYFVSGAFLIAAVAWPTTPEPSWTIPITAARLERVDLKK
jgi:hypothetical protein